MSANGSVEPTEHHHQVNGVELCCFEWPGAKERAQEPTVLLVHATGFHARCWDQVVAHLPGRHIYAVDMRGHGRSEKTGPFTWDTFGRDLAELVATLKLHDAVGVGHSMGGHSLVQAAAAHPDAFRHLLLIDPVIMAPETYSGAPAWPEGTEHPTARRRNQWSSWQEMVQSFHDRKPFVVWDPAVLEDYCRHGLLAAAPDEGYVLACPPQVEASIYMNSTGTDIYPLVDTLATPVTVIRAREPATDRDIMDFSNSPTWPQLAARFPHGRDLHLPELTHFIPMEAPARAAGYIQTPSLT